MAVAIEYGSQLEAGTTSSVATFSGMDFNAEASDRIIVAAISFQDTDSIASVTIGGVTADLYKASVGAFLAIKAELWGAEVPTGTSGDVVVALASGDESEMSVATFSVTGADPTPTDTDSASGNVADISITSLTVPSGGAGIASYTNNGDPTATDWTGASEVLDIDVGTFMHSAAIITTEGTNTITADGATADQALVGVAFGPASGGGTVSGESEVTLAPYAQTATGKVIAAAVATQTLAPYGQTATGEVVAQGSAVQQLAGYGQTATGKVVVTGRQEP